MSGLLDDATPELGLPHWTQSIDAQPSFPVLFPLSDLINHQPEAKMTWGKGSTHMSFIIEEEVKPGKPIWNNYGPKSNQQCERKIRSSHVYLEIEHRRGRLTTSCYSTYGLRVRRLF